MLTRSFFRLSRLSYEIAEDKTTRVSLVLATIFITFLTSGVEQGWILLASGIGGPLLAVYGF
jgi:hypothetical protein